MYTNEIEYEDSVNVNRVSVVNVLVQHYINSPNGGRNSSNIKYNKNDHRFKCITVHFQIKNNLLKCIKWVKYYKNDTCDNNEQPNKNLEL